MWNLITLDAPVNNQETTFTITDTTLYVPVVTLSNQDKAAVEITF